jgi:hypothetical protein
VHPNIDKAIIAKGAFMERCDKCGNAYEKAFKVMMNDKSYTFDCFECAIGMLAPICATCGTQIIGHGMESGDDFFCCAGCARHQGITDLKDHVEQL